MYFLLNMGIFHCCVDAGGDDFILKTGFVCIPTYNILVTIQLLTNLPTLKVRLSQQIGLSFNSRKQLPKSQVWTEHLTNNLEPFDDPAVLIGGCGVWAFF